MIGVATWVILVVVAAVVFVVLLLMMIVSQLYMHGNFSLNSKRWKTFLRDITNDAHNGSLDPVVGREDEIERLVHILSRRVKHNAVLVGEFGVGKTATIHGLAIMIAERSAPEHLQGARLLQLDLQGLIASFEKETHAGHALGQMINHLAQEQNIILFVDDIHKLVDDSVDCGAESIAGVLVGAVARGELQMIGATTPHRFKDSLQTNETLERFFQLIHIKEPNATQTLEILEAVKTRYEEFHTVSIKPSALKAVVELSKHYLSQKPFPEIAIELLDEAAAHVRLYHDVRVHGEGVPNVTKHDVEQALKHLNKHHLTTRT